VAYNIPVRVKTTEFPMMAGVATITEEGEVTVSISGPDKFGKELYQLALTGLLKGFILAPEFFEARRAES
jgi:hypothetical protein